MKKYNPDVYPNPKVWLALEETEQQRLVEVAHQKSGLTEGQLAMHASGHVTVETQLAMELPHVVDNFKRLMKEGLGRHDALHACCAIVMEMIFNGIQDKGEVSDEYYAKRLGELTAKKWWDQTY